MQWFFHWVCPNYKMIYIQIQLQLLSYNQIIKYINSSLALMHIFDLQMMLIKWLGSSCCNVSSHAQWRWTLTELDGCTVSRKNYSVSAALVHTLIVYKQLLQSYADDSDDSKACGWLPCTPFRVDSRQTMHRFLLTFIS